VPEMVREDESALLVPAGAAAPLTDALQRLIDTPERWPEMGRAGRAHVEAQHDLHRLKSRLAEILRGAR
jgi:colanic acid/amylovoran biosynthesis glycosyltransferase